MNIIKISPSLMCADLANLGEEVKTLTSIKADQLHFDIMDGNFVPDIGLSHLEIKAVRHLTPLLFEAHMMIVNPLRYVGVFVEAGADIICIHAESCTNLYKVIQEIKQRGKKAGVALNPATPLCMVENILTEIDLILLMMVSPGYKVPGVKSAGYFPGVLEKASCLREIIRKKELNIDIEADGSVNEKSIVNMAGAGINVFVVGSALFDERPLSAHKIQELRNRAEKAFLEKWG